MQPIKILFQKAIQCQLKRESDLFGNPNRTAKKTHSISVIKPHRLTLYEERDAVCFEIDTKHIKTLFMPSVEFLNIIPVGVKIFITVIVRRSGRHRTPFVIMDCST